MTRITQQQLESYLWGAAVLLRGTIDAGDYKQFIFPLLFYKRLCDVFDEETQIALAESGGDTEFAAYPENHRFQVPPEAHWRQVRQVAANVGQALQSAMRAIETANPDKLYGIFGDAQWTNKDRLSDAMLRDLVEHFSRLDLTIANLPEDELGQGYEYLIKKFADDSGHTAAEFYTNRTVVHLMTELLEPQPGESIYDPTCGSGGMLLSTIAHLRRQGKEWRNVRLYGQERNMMTSSIARMNCFLHGIEDFQIVRGDTLAEPKLVQGDRLMQFDVVLANPPYSIKQWDREAFASDPWGRNLYGTPPQGRADYAFWQHILCSLKPGTGRCAILFPHGVLFRHEEAEMRRKLIEADAIECVLGLGPNLFYNSAMEACVVICRTNKPAARKGRILFINAANEVTRERDQSFLTDDHIQRIVKAYEDFTDELGFTSVASLDEISKQKWSLSIPVYVRNLQYQHTRRRSVDSSLEDMVFAWQNTAITFRKSLGAVLGTAIDDKLISGMDKLRIEMPGWVDRSKWKRVRLGDVVRQVRDKVGDAAAAGITHYLPGGGIGANDFRITEWREINDGLMGPAFHMRMKLGHVLYKSRVPHGVAVADRIGICANTTFVLEAIPEQLDQRLLPFLLVTNAFRQFETINNRGSTNLFLNYSDIARFEFDLPPLDQQCRIAKILWSADEVAQTYQDLLSNLSEHLRALRSKMAGGESIDQNGITSPHRMVHVRDVGATDEQVVQVGPFGGSLCSRHFTSTGIPVVKVNNITADNTIDLAKAVFVSPSHAQSLIRYRVKPGDILIAAQGDSTGRSGLAGTDADGAIISQHLARVTVNREICRPEFLAELFRSELIQRQVNAVKLKTTRPGLNTDDIAGFVIPLPSIVEQDEFCSATLSAAKSIGACSALLTALKNLQFTMLNEIWE
ncbi:MAG: N-6 DNA methylase [Chloroflexota bacterium]|nr:N-6 DNA methylase [Chloroflexota bacterium]